MQRVAVATAATMCRSLTPDNLDAVSTAVPSSPNLLQYQVWLGLLSCLWPGPSAAKRQCRTALALR